MLSTTTSSRPANSTKRSPTRLRMSMKRRVSPELSLKQTIVSQSARDCEDFGRDVVLVDRWIVVDHDRQVGCLGHGAEMRRGFVRLRRVDQRRHHHHAVEADARGVPHHVDRESRGEFGDSADDRDAPARNGFPRLHHRDLLVLRERGVLADGAADDQARHPVADQAFHDASGGVDVERKIVAKLRRHCRKNAAPVRFQSPSPG